MKKQRYLEGVNRRDFLKAFGMVTGALAAYPLQAHAKLLFGNPHDVTVGAIVPESTLNPLLGESFITGMKLRFAELGWDGTKVVVEHTGTSTSLAVAKAHSLVTDGRADILTGFLNPLHLSGLKDVLAQTGALFVNAEAGANLSAPGEEIPNIFHNSLGYWQANMAMGTWTATGMGKRVSIVTSFYESGYDSAFAFRKGFEEAGGKVVSSDVTHVPPLPTDFTALMETIRKARPDFVYAIYSGQAAVDFVTAYAASGLAAEIPLTASGFAVDDALLPTMGKAALGIKSCFSWAPGLRIPQNTEFCAGFSRRAGRDADVSALLGYDTAGMIAQSVRSAAEWWNSGSPDALHSFRFDGPRGSCRIDPKTGNMDTPLYLREVRREGGALRNVVIAELSRVAASGKRADQLLSGVKTGWLDTYLFV